MKLLLDQNLSPRLVEALAEVYPECAHTSRIGLARASDSEVWSYARDHGYMIVTKDADFNELAAIIGVPPKILRLKMGNCSTRVIEATLRAYEAAIRDFSEDAAAGVLELP